MLHHYFLLPLFLSIAVQSVPSPPHPLLLPLRLPPSPSLCSTAARPPSSLPSSLPNLPCTWPTIFSCAAAEISCGQACLETVQRTPSEISSSAPIQCVACLGVEKVQECSPCFSVPVASLPGRPQPLIVLPGLSRTALCVAAGEGCVAEAFCDVTPSALQGEISSGTSTTAASATATETRMSSEEGGGGDGGTTGATGLCGSFHCLGS